MHARTESQDSTYNIRRNPLNIRHMDGTDFILHKKQAVSEETDFQFLNNDVQDNQSPDTKPSPTDLLLNSMIASGDSSSDELAGLLPQSAKMNRGKHLSMDLDRELRDETTSLQSVAMSVKDKEKLLVDQPQQQSQQEYSQRLDQSDRPFMAPRLSLNNLLALDVKIESENLSKSFRESLNASGLARNNTITSIRERTVPGPSQSPQLFERLRKARNKIASQPTHELLAENDYLTQQLVAVPTPLLNAISFTPKVVEQRHSPALSLVSIKSDTVSTMSSLRDCEESQCPSLASRGEDSATCDDEQESIYEADYSSSPSEPPSPLIESSPTLADLDPPAKNDRGRLFLKVEGLKDLRLPLDASRNQKVTLTLDNGLQTVTTSPTPLAELKKTGLIPIDQEFELLVGDDLELILTMNAIQDLPPKSIASSLLPAGNLATTPPSSPKKKRFSFFGSPKKKEKATIGNIGSPVQQLSKDPWTDMIGPNGEFGRAYIVESQFEAEIYGRKQTFVVSCFNEWAVKRRPITHDFSQPKKGQKPPQFSAIKKEPFRIGGLQVSMLYIPKFCKSEQLPGSMRQCLHELKRASAYRGVHFEGYLSQQGGDCSFWRRRWFTLNGSNLIGHHEQSRKVRVEINMTNVRDIMEFSSVPSYEIDVPCINEDRSFRIMFKDQETLSFYADSIEEKDEWLKNLKTAMLHCSGKPRRWTDLVLTKLQEVSEKKTLIKEKDEQRLVQMNHGNSSFIEEL